MAAEDNRDARPGEVDRRLQEWRQGDCVLGEHWFVHRIDETLPVTDAGRVAADAGANLAEIEVSGLVVVTQTCDVVRPCDQRPYVEVCPLVEVDERRLREIERGRRPGYAYLPLVAPRRLVADLDRVMTVEKPVVASWQRTTGWTTDAEGRAFARALARKRVRFAFPDDFVELTGKLQGRLAEKHDRETAEGRALRALREIRVHAYPDWGSDPATLTFWFVRSSEDVEFEGKSWADFLQVWLDLVPRDGRFRRVFGQVTTLEEMTAADFVHSDPLDLDHLSSPGGASNA